MRAGSAPLPPHAPCRLQQHRRVVGSLLQALPPHAPCRLQLSEGAYVSNAALFASTRPVQIATTRSDTAPNSLRLCLHTPRADCNQIANLTGIVQKALPPHAPCRLQRDSGGGVLSGFFFASTRPVQIATSICVFVRLMYILCLHTPRADCNAGGRGHQKKAQPLCLHTPRADCNRADVANVQNQKLCLHTPRADCNPATSDKPVTRALCLHTPRADCNFGGSPMW